MSSKKKKNRQLNKNNVALMIEYYNHVFVYLHQQLAKTGISFINTPNECIKFWQLVPHRLYNNIEAHQLLSQYLKIVEDKLAVIIKKYSLAYWLHLYRRLSPKPIGKNDNPATTLAVRSSLEAAFQKYAKLEQCDRVALSTSIHIEKVLNGMLVVPAFEMIKRELKNHPQLVLTDFGLDELIELYRVERLCYEIWRTMAMMRTVGKGANLVVLSKEPYFYDTRDDELAELIEYYDSRHRREGATISGVMFDQDATFENGGFQPLLYYNVLQSTIEPYMPLFKHYKFDLLDKSFKPNFVWGPFALKEYYNSHCYYSEEYLKTTHIEFSHIIVFLGALFHMQVAIFGIERNYILKMFQRAYEGPYLKTEIISDIKKFLNYANDYLKILPDIQLIEVEKIFEYFSLKESDRLKIDVSLGGPMKIFLPLNNERYFIDYAWISWIFYTFFWGINPSDQNFKGTVLENIINKNESVLPTTPCKSINGSKKQIDGSFEIGDFLLIVECKAKGQSFAFERGDIDSINFRKQFIFESLLEIDEKAKWLINNPIGTNYNITKYQGIIPIITTPFNEFIPSLNKFYWLDKIYARVFTPAKLEDFINADINNKGISLFNNIYWNESKLIVKS